MRACQRPWRSSPSAVTVLVPLALSFAIEATELPEGPRGAALTVIVSCPLLDAEQTAAVQARVQADFLAEGSPGGQLTLTCPDERAVAHFDGGGSPIDVEQPRAPDAPTDALLRVAYEVASQVKAVPPRPDVAPDLETPPTPQPAPATAAPEPEPRHQVEERNGPAANPDTPPQLPKQARAAVALDVGALAEHWGRATAGTLGVELGVESAPAEGLRLGGKATFATGWGLPGELDVKSLTPELLVAAAVVPEWLTLRAGPALSVMIFSGEGLVPQRVTTTTLGAELELLLTPTGDVRGPWLSLGLRGYARDRRIVIGEEQVLRVPRLAALFGAGWRL
jgi:hypothetical protein